MQRVLVAGISGAGKTTIAIKIEKRLGLPRYELDALCHGPEWVKRPEFEEDVGRFVVESRWVCEDQYHNYIGDLLWGYADTVVWLDLPRRTVIWRVLRRSLWRVTTRQRLWNDNRETWRAMFFSSTHPARWAWTQHHRRRQETVERIARHPQVTVVCLTSALEAKRWVSTLM
jgi:adenylate kinase family enzyme